MKAADLRGDAPAARRRFTTTSCRSAIRSRSARTSSGATLRRGAAPTCALVGALLRATSPGGRRCSHEEVGQLPGRRRQPREGGARRVARRARPRDVRGHAPRLRRPRRRRGHHRLRRHHARHDALRHQRAPRFAGRDRELAGHARLEREPGGRSDARVVHAASARRRGASAAAPNGGSGAEEDAVFTLAAVVTREGRIDNLEVLHGDRRRQAGADEAKLVEGLLDAVSRARFEPARVAGLPGRRQHGLAGRAHHRARAASTRPFEPPVVPAPKKRARVASRRAARAPRRRPAARAQPDFARRRRRLHLRRRHVVHRIARPQRQPALAQCRRRSPARSASSRESAMPSAGKTARQRWPSCENSTRWMGEWSSFTSKATIVRPPSTRTPADGDGRRRVVDLERRALEFAGQRASRAGWTARPTRRSSRSTCRSGTVVVSQTRIASVRPCASVFHVVSPSRR